MNSPTFPDPWQAGGTKQEPSAHANTAGLARRPAKWDPAPFSQNTTARPTDWLELLGFRRLANKTGWGAGSYLAVADCQAERRQHETRIIPLWRRVAGGLEVAL